MGNEEKNQAIPSGNEARKASPMLDAAPAFTPSVPPLHVVVENASAEDWGLVKDTAGKVASRETVFELAFKFGWHAASKHLRGDDSWQPIETAPKGRKAVLGFWPGKPVSGRNYAIMRRTRTGWVSYDEPLNLDYAVTPTHWMPLPAPPNTQGAPTRPQRAAQQQRDGREFLDCILKRI